MGVALVLGVAALIAAIIGRAGTHAPPAGFGTAKIELPAGARIEETSLLGERLIVRAFLPDGGVEVLVIDVRSGARLGAIEIGVKSSP